MRCLLIVPLLLTFACPSDCFSFFAEKIGKGEVSDFLAPYLDLCPEEIREEAMAGVTAGKDCETVWRKILKSAGPAVDRTVNGRTDSLRKGGVSILPYDTLTSGIAYFWGEGFRQRGLYESRLLETVKAIGEIDELKRRLLDHEDSLDDIEKYRNLLKLPGVPGQLYWLAEKIYFHGADYPKAYRCLKFFLLPENPDGFTIGAAHYFVGTILVLASENLGEGDFIECQRKAIPHLVKVPLYPTCLTYTAYAYTRCAEVAMNFEDYHSALALLHVDVPCVDYEYSLWKRDRYAAECCIYLKNYTNMVKHLQRFGQFRRDESMSYVEGMVKKLPYYDKESLWNYCLTNKLDEADSHAAIEAALTNETSVIEFDDLLGMLTIDWPKAAELPENVRTNRLLNNHFFKSLHKSGVKRQLRNAEKEGAKQ